MCACNLSVLVKHNEGNLIIFLKKTAFNVDWITELIHVYSERLIKEQNDITAKNGERQKYLSIYLYNIVYTKAFLKYDKRRAWDLRKDLHKGKRYWNEGSDCQHWNEFSICVRRKRVKENTNININPFFFVTFH